MKDRERVRSRVHSRRGESSCDPPPVRRSISRWVAPPLSSVSTVRRRCSFKTFTPSCSPKRSTSSARPAVTIPRSRRRYPASGWGIFEVRGSAARSVPVKVGTRVLDSLVEPVHPQQGLQFGNRRHVRGFEPQTRWGASAPASLAGTSFSHSHSLPTRHHQHLLNFRDITIGC